MSTQKGKVTASTYASQAPGKEIAKRSRYNRVLNQASLREKIESQHHATRAFTCLQKLAAMEQSIQKCRTALTRDEVNKLTLRTGILKTQFEGHMKLLNKVLPDLRSMNFEDQAGDNPFEKAAAAWAEALSQ